MLTYIALVLAVVGLSQVVAVVRGLFRGVLVQPRPVVGLLMKSSILACGLFFLYISFTLFQRIL